MLHEGRFQIHRLGQKEASGADVKEWGGRRREMVGRREVHAKRWATVTVWPKGCGSWRRLLRKIDFGRIFVYGAPCAEAMTSWQAPLPEFDKLPSLLEYTDL